MNIKEMKLNGWPNINVLANIEEDINDILAVVIYEDHGDKYAVVKTKDGAIYEYGVYATRRDYDERDSDYIRLPKMNEPDEHYKLLNLPYTKYPKDESGINGIAGKKKCYKIIYGDYILSAYYNGEDVPTSEIVAHYEYDDSDDHERFSLDMSQFGDENYSQKLREQVLERLNDHIQHYESIKEHIDDIPNNGLCSIINSLDNFWLDYEEGDCDE